MSIPIDLSGKVAIVTGGGRGIGRAIAVALAQAGADVCITARTETQLKETASLVEKTGQKVLVVPADATSASEVEGVVKKAIAEFGDLHILCNNAGMDYARPLLEHTEADYDRIMNTNVKSMFLFTKAVGPHMIAGKFGRIVNTASVGAFVAGRNQSVYHASKAATAHFTRAMAIEWAPFGITVNAIAPGWIDTDLIAHLKENKEMLDKYMKGIPLRRLGKPEEVAPMVAFLCSEHASFMTGSIILIDGGLVIP